MTPYKITPNGVVLDVIEDYSSLIWTERFDSHGEFQLKTADIDQGRIDLPLGHLIGLSDSDVQMFIENHSITDNDEGIDELVVTGRSYERILLESRTFFDDDYPIDLDAGLNETIPQVLVRIMRNRLQTGYVLRSQDAVNGLTILNNTTFNSGVKDDVMTVDSGDLYATVSKYLKPEKYGLKYGPGKQIILYNGTDRSTGSNAMTLYKITDDLLNPKYLKSYQSFKNVAYVTSPAGFFVVYAPGWNVSTAVGSNRRILTINTSEDNLGTATDLAFYTELAQKELAKNYISTVIDAEISPDAKFKFGLNYFLGDTLKIVGDYGFSQTMVVSEYVRSEENGVERAYPGLIEKE